MIKANIQAKKQIMKKKTAFRDTITKQFTKTTEEEKKLCLRNYKLQNQHLQNFQSFVLQFTIHPQSIIS